MSDRAERCAKCGHGNGYHGATFCVHRSGSAPKRDCDCDGWLLQPQLSIAGPNDVVILASHQPITAQHAERIHALMPEHLRHRVLVVDGLEPTIVQDAAS